jgi:hypothetical protein
MKPFKLIVLTLSLVALLAQTACNCNQKDKAADKGSSINYESFFGTNSKNDSIRKDIELIINNIGDKEEITENEAYAIGVMAYIYTFSIVEVERSLYNFTHLLSPGQFVYFGGWNRFWVSSILFTPDIKAIVSPNNDTQYGSAAVDLSKEPVLIYTQDIGDRYYSYQIMDAHANSFAYLGTQATNGKEGVYALVGPNWEGELPEGVEEIKSPTPHVWLAARILVDNSDEIPVVTEIYRKNTIAPLSSFQKEKGNDLEIARPDQLDEPLDIEGLKYFRFANEVLSINHPDEHEKAIINLFSKIHIDPDSDFNLNTIPDNIKKGLKKAIPIAKEVILNQTSNLGENMNGWDLAKVDWGIYGDNYIQRAAVALEQLATNTPVEALYASGRVDDKGEKLNGKNKYILKFKKGETPPVNAFWSLTMYDVPNYFLVHNDLKRYAIGDRSGMKYNEDGSLEIYIQNESPGTDKESNWLPAPGGPFYMLLRMYNPKDEILKGDYSLPPIQILK